MITETIIKGYHLFALCGKETDESIRFEEIENDLGDGAESSILFGSVTGLRSFKLTFPSLPGTQSDQTVEYDGSELTKEEYIWALYCDYKTSRKPFIVKGKNEQYYLVKFAPGALTYNRTFSKLYSTGIEFRQVKPDDVSVFDISRAKGVGAWLKPESYEPFPNIWPSEVGAFELSSEGDVTTVAGPNDRTLIRMNATVGAVPTPGPDGGYFHELTHPLTVYDALMIIKVREDEFSNYGGILSAGVSAGALVGELDTTTLYDLTGDFAGEYTFYNGIIPYEADNQQMPMNALGLIHARWSEGLTLSNWQLGKDRDFVNRFGKVDFGDLVFMTMRRPLSELYEISDHLLTEWDV